MEGLVGGENTDGASRCVSGTTGRKTLPRIFAQELRGMMYGFGDAVRPSKAAVDMMEEILLDHLFNLVSKTTEVAHIRKRDRPDITDVKFVIRRDRRRTQRVRYLLQMKASIDGATSMKELAMVAGEEVPGAPPKV
ncbi:Transcription initiation factor TFIID subunit 13 [Porphyridium purpureum]|uniref:Transcription initiation factor TFIID subunit 13 n=1 Tax=Porphyridium purpureum TaxID=35688 RepID=A0A5J4Z1N7_PORPP|nr:Transcription initiation factor TFIID subunit 13 [Porphyridium purpureum]|eukprot:POR4663..scf208_2